MNVSPTMTVLWTRLVSQKNVLTPVLVLSVEPELFAKLNFTQQFAIVLQAFKAMNMLLVWKSNVQQMMTVQAMKSATFPKEVKEKNACHFVLSPGVHLVPSVQQTIIEKSAHVGHHWRAMAMLPVQSVRLILWHLFIIRLICIFQVLKYFTFYTAVVAEEPECRVDQDCPSKLACISQSCQNPCNINNPCQFDQRCVVIDSLPSRSVACVCPEGTVLGNNGQCTQGNSLSWFRILNFWSGDRVVIVFFSLQ